MDASSPDVMLAYYKRLFPFKSLFTWINQDHQPRKLFTNREFAFTLPGDVYLRYQSFNNAEDLKKQVCALNPSRFEIGPQYTLRPRDKKTHRPSAFYPEQRELVFDIDMTDYDSIRTCCSGTGMCRKCWAFIAAAVHVLDAAVRDQFGFKHLLWVYSGRRGIHLWISDQDAMTLSDDQRKAIVGWLSVISGGKEMHKKVNVRQAKHALPPSLEDALTFLSPAFVDVILANQECFSSEQGIEALLQLLPAPTASQLRREWQDKEGNLVNAPSSSDKVWAAVRLCLKQAKENESSSFGPLRSAMQDIILQYTYPRLDAEVSKHRNHLLKSPFCIHPKTSRVCVPIDPKLVDDFDPEKVPTVGQLLRELDEAAEQRKQDQDDAMEGTGDGKEREARGDWERTSLKPYVAMLDQHNLAIMNDRRLINRTKGRPDMTW